MNLPRHTVLVLLLTLVTGGLLRAKDSPKTILDRLPDRLAGCQKGDLHNYDDPRLGSSVSYNIPGMTITVYAYDLGQQTIADGLDDPIVQNAFQMAKNEIQGALKQGIYSEATLISEGKGTFHQHEATWQAKYELTRKGERDSGLKVFSEIHIFGAWNQIIKLRISGDLRAREKNEPIAQQFVADFLKAVEFLPPRP